LGDKNASTGKYLTSHSLSGLAEWFGVGSSLTGAAHTAGYDVELNELVYKALVDLENNTPISAASKRDIQPKSVAQAVKAYYRKGTRDYKTDANGKIIHADERDYYSANRFFRKGSAVQFDGQFASGEKGYNYYKFTDQETGESMFIQ
jgi:hypothetical protein